MHVIRKIDELRRYRNAAKGKVALVPTLGYLHQGHASLIRSAKKECDIVIVSIFVNPLQFGPKEDLDKYPRDLKRDKKLCEKEGADCIFCPDESEMYPQGSSLTTINVGQITNHLCALSRPHHFNGVATVVTKLFNIVSPHYAYFGQKDLQQSVVVKRMVADLNIPTIIRVCPIVREKDGLAMSSRNVYLSSKERKIAPILYKSLQLASKMFKEGERDPATITHAVTRKISQEVTAKIGRIEYVEIVDVKSLESVHTVRNGNAIALAIFIGRTRLIDNIIF